MKHYPVDPAQLSGEALRRWYQRTPQEMEEERGLLAEQRYQDFFGQPSSPGVERLSSHPAALSAPTDKTRLQPALAGDQAVLWKPDGRGGYRAIRPGRLANWPDEADDESWPSSLPANPAAPEDGLFVNVGNPANEQYKREHIKKKGFWPKTPDGRDYVVSHIRAIGDGGTNTPDNMEPMDPDEHREKHRRDGDNQRFGKRAGIARAFGGKVEPPLHAPRRSRGPTLRGLGPLSIIPNITGILSGRIRTDNLDNFVSDMFGYPSEEDIRRRNEEHRRRNHPNSKPGYIFA